MKGHLCQKVPLSTTNKLVIFHKEKVSLYNWTICFAIKQGHFFPCTLQYSTTKFYVIVMLEWRNVLWLFVGKDGCMYEKMTSKVNHKKSVREFCVHHTFCAKAWFFKTDFWKMSISRTLLFCFYSFKVIMINFSNFFTQFLGCCDTVKQTIQNVDFFFNKSDTDMSYVSVDYPSLVIKYR